MSQQPKAEIFAESLKQFRDIQEIRESGDLPAEIERRMEAMKSVLQTLHEQEGLTVEDALMVTIGALAEIAFEAKLDPDAVVEEARSKVLGFYFLKTMALAKQAEQQAEEILRKANS